MFIFGVWERVPARISAFVAARSHIARHHRLCSFSSYAKIAEDSTSTYRQRIRRTGVLGISAATLTAISAYLFHDALYVPDSVKVTKDAIRNNEGVKELIGDNIVFHGDWRLEQEGDRTHVQMGASGKKSSGTFFCTLVNADNRWRVVNMDIIYNQAKDSPDSADQSAMKLYDELHKAMKM